MKFLLLLKLELKTSLKKIPRLIIGAIALIGLISVIAFCCNKYLYGADFEHKFSISLVIEDDSDIMESITDIVMDSDAVNEYISFNICDRETMYNNIKSGKDLAGIILQKDAAKDIMNSVNTPIEIVFPDNAGFEAAVIKEITDAVGKLLQTAESGVYTSVDFYKENGNLSEKGDMIDRLNIKYLSIVFFRNSAFKDNIVNGTGDISILHYFICAGIVLFMMLFSINISTIYRYYTPHFTYKLIHENVGISKQVFIKYCTVLLQYLIFIVVFIPIGLIFLKPLFILKILFPIIISAIVISALTVLVYEIFTNKNACIMFLFISSVLLAFVSGCFIPSLMLPDFINTFSEYFPISYILKMLTSVFENSSYLCNIPILLIFTMFYLCFAVLIKKHKTTNELAGGS